MYGGIVKDVTEERLSDRIAIGLLAWAYPPQMIERVIRRCGRLGVRNRLLPPQIMVYFVLVMCMFPNESYEDVARLLAVALPLANPDGELRLREIPSTAAVSRARMRLGAEPMKALFEDASRQPVLGGIESRYRGRRLRTLDGRLTGVSDAPEEAAVADGRKPGGTSSDLRITVLAADGTGLPLGAEILPAGPDAPVVGRPLLAQLGVGDLLLADGEYACPALWRTVAATGADLLWSLPAQALPAEPGVLLADGSRLVAPPGPPDQGAAAAPRVRVIDRLPGDRAADGGASALVTTFLDPATAPAGELRGVHANRWSFLRAADQLQAFRNHPKRALRSRSPEMIEQELWGYLLLYRAMRSLTNNSFS
jgi:hypothetical protein